MKLYVFTCTALLFLTGCQSPNGVYGPVGDQSRPGVVILPTSGGVHHEPTYALELSRRGFQTVVADYHQPGYYARIDEAYDKLRLDPRVGKIGIVGFSRGGYVAGNYAINQNQNRGRDIAAIVSFYTGPSPPHFPHGTTPAMLPPFLFLHGELDNYISPERLGQFCHRVDPEGKKCQVVVFKRVGHAFDQLKTKPHYAGYDRKATLDSYEMAVDWLNRWLR